MEGRLTTFGVEGVSPSELPHSVSCNRDPRTGHLDMEDESLIRHMPVTRAWMAGSLFWGSHRGVDDLLDTSLED